MCRKRSAVLVLAGVLLLAVGPLVGGQAPEVIGTMTNFDVINLSGCPVDDFEVCFYDEAGVGLNGLGCIESWYHGWGTPPTIIQNREGFCVRWLDCNRAVLPGDIVHFGLHLDPKCLDTIRETHACVRAFWTVGGYRVQEVPLPLQTWLAQDGVVIDLIRYCNDDVGPVEIERGFATLSEIVDLELLMWDNLDSLLSEYATSSEFLNERLILYPNEGEAALEIHPQPGDRAILVWYTVRVNGEISTRVINEAILGGCW